ncbi:hypothetical protein DVJ77_08460 [Dyella tabacisoli]|uniref:Uncharacterized protein n=1 Tax=Dyella tabacisoli TaxID=2282381 RepID=A0A369UPW2_9GAMM|nr:hypothetical protein DVJ77_08460 [Dyella tabacisoli]
MASIMGSERVKMDRPARSQVAGEILRIHLRYGVRTAPARRVSRYGAMLVFGVLGAAQTVSETESAADCATPA